MLLNITQAYLLLLSSQMSNLWINSAVNGRPRVNRLFLPCEASYLWRYGLPRLEVSIITSKLSSKYVPNTQSGSYLPPLSREHERLQPKNKSADNIRGELYISIPPFDFRHLRPIGEMHNRLVCRSEGQELSFRMPIWPYAGDLGVIEEDPNAGTWRPVIWDQNEVKVAEWNRSPGGWNSQPWR
jgi:hypothetical protein